MISFEQVRRGFQGFSPQRLAGLIGPVLRGEATLPLSGGRADELPEDLLGQLLADAETSEELRQIILDGCERLFLEALSAVRAVSGLPKAAPVPLEKMFVRLCRIVDIAKPRELCDLSVSLLEILLGYPKVRPNLLGACVRAAMAYPAEGQAAGVWNKLLRRRDLAAYGFRALLALQPAENKVIGELVRLWRHRLVDGWTADAALLTLQASRQAGFDDSLIYKTLAALRARHSRLWPRAVEELERRSLTRKWLRAIKAEDLESHSLVLEWLDSVDLKSGTAREHGVSFSEKILTVQKTVARALSKDEDTSADDPQQRRYFFSEVKQQVAAGYRLDDPTRNSRSLHWILPGSQRIKISRNLSPSRLAPAAASHSSHFSLEAIAEMVVAPAYNRIQIHNRRVEFDPDAPCQEVTTIMEEVT